MNAKLRHAGLVVKNLEASIEFYKFFGFRKVHKGIETWNGKRLRICKMESDAGMIELIEGDWRPHISITVKEDVMEAIWLRFGGKYGTIMERQNRLDKTIVYLKDPDGNYLEVVYER